MDGARFDGCNHFDAGSQMEIFYGGACDDGGERKSRFEINTNERAHRNDVLHDGRQVISGASCTGADWFEHDILCAYADEHVRPDGFLAHAEKVHPLRLHRHQSIGCVRNPTGNDGFHADDLGDLHVFREIEDLLRGALLQYFSVF